MNIEAANLVEDHDQDKEHGNAISPVPAYFLAVHGIELTLKAYLRHGGLSNNELRGKQFGHSLHRCYRKAKELGLLDHFKEHQNDIDAMWMLEQLNEHHGLRYIRTGQKFFPLWSLVKPLAVRLHQAVAPLVGYKTFYRSFPEYEA
jgi:hypothetical protein